MTSHHISQAHATDRWWWAAFGALCLILVAPLLVVDVPPLGDYPNHLARLFVLASLPQDSVLAGFYAAHWSIIPNLALDIIAPPLMQVLPVQTVGRLLIAVSILLPVFGTVAYSAVLGGRWWSLGVGLIAYNSCLLYGFLNFAISIGIALILAATWLRWREPRPALAIALCTFGAPILFACHLMGLVFLGTLLAGDELSKLYRNRSFPFWTAAIGRGAVLLLVGVIPSILYAFSALGQLGGDAEFLPAGQKLRQLATTFVNYNWTLDMTAASVAIAVPVIGVIMKLGKLPTPSAISIALLLILFLGAPFAWKGTYGLDTRFAIMFGFMLFAGFVPARWPVWLSRVSTGVVLLLFIARMALLTYAWTAHRSDLDDLRRVLAPVQPGQAVYVVEAGLSEAPSYWAGNPGWRLLSNGVRTDEHIGALALIERRAYWPFLFDNPSQQPIKTLEPYQTLATRVGSLPTAAQAAVADVCGFDYALVTGADAVPDLPAARFQLLTRSGFAALYKIVRCAQGSNDPPVPR